MANGLERESEFTMFSEEELSEVSGVKRVGDYVEVMCGCTSHRYGDAVGRLKAIGDRYPCHLDKLTPSAFEKHSGRETARKWKNNVWVIVNGEKVPLCKTVLLKYYNQVSKAANGSHRSQNGRACHRDEFVRCTRCNKERRFRLRTKEECRTHHDAVADANWKCSDLPYDNGWKWPMDINILKLAFDKVNVRKMMGALTVHGRRVYCEYMDQIRMVNDRYKIVKGSVACN
ncbi:Developmental regulator, ULTRAPETALA [Sesbania bispinosa]|nr:Developmental regulator, ULTRAPETALA [Sesbania bispinosa]